MPRKIIMGIYQIRNTLNGKIYIGSSNNKHIRWGSHKSQLKRNCHHSKYLQNAWNKYGKKYFVFEMLEILEDEEDLHSVEQAYLDNLQPEYNVGKCVRSAMIGRTHTEEAREKLRLANLGHVVTEETRKKIGDANRGERNGMWGKKMSDEAKKKIGKSRLGKLHHYFGKTLSKEHKQKLSISLSGNNNPMWGKTHSTSVREYLSEINRKIEPCDYSIIKEMYATDNYTQKELAKMWNVGSSTISRIVNGYFDE